MKKDEYKKIMPVHYSFFRNYLLGIIFNYTDYLEHRIIVRDVYGEDHEILYKLRPVNKVLNNRHVYHMRYRVKVPKEILFLRLERKLYFEKEWEAVSAIDFAGDYARGVFKPGWYTLFDSFRWNDVFDTTVN